MLWVAALVSARAHPNLLLIVVDDLGVDQVNAYLRDDYTSVPPPASPPPRTETLSRLADEGVRFTRAWASPECSPTRSGLLTGSHPFRTGIGGALSESDPGLADVVQTLPEALAAQGYTSGLFGKWHLGDWGYDADTGAVRPPLYRCDPEDERCPPHDPLRPGPTWEVGMVNSLEAWPNRQGFDVFAGTLQGALADYWRWSRVIGERGSPAVVDEPGAYTTSVTAANATSFLLTATPPWLAVVSFNAPHSDTDGPPYDAAHVDEACVGELAHAVPPTRQEVYAAMVQCVDHHVGEMLWALEDAGRRSDTVVLVMGDNGTPDDIMDDAFPRGGASGGKFTSFESGIRVPLIVAGHTGSGIGAGVDSDALVSTVDVFDTALELAGATPTGLDSVSLLPALRGQGGRRSLVYTEEFEPAFGAHEGHAIVRDERWKLVVEQEVEPVPPHRVCQRLSLYDLGEGPALGTEDDRGEDHDLAVAPSPPERAVMDELREVVDRTLSSVAEPWLWNRAARGLGIYDPERHTCVTSR